MIQMPPKRLLATICLALLTVTAGCGFIAGSGGQSTPTAAGADAPTPTERPQATAAPDSPASVTPTEMPDGTAEPTPTAAEPTERDENRVAVEGNLSFNATEVFERVERLHGVDVDPPNVLVDERRPILTTPSPFVRAFGVSGRVSAAGQAVDQETVFLASGLEVPEVVLAHEFAHNVHQQSGWQPVWPRSAPADRYDAVTAINEGAAVYVADSYVEDSDRNLTADSRSLRRGYENASTYGRLFISYYLVGADYVEAQVTSPSDLEPVMRDPPETTEQLLHPERNVSLGNLTVEPRESPDWTVEIGHYPSDADRRGELVVRELLRLELDRERADAAANGWDNDRSLTFTSTADENETGFAWSIRADNASEADELAQAFETFAERRAANSTSSFGVERVAPETVVVLAGNESFVDGTTVSVTNESVRVTAPGTNGTAATATANPALVG